jgi:hypothetical protein
MRLLLPFLISPPSFRRRRRRASYPAAARTQLPATEKVFEKNAVVC